MPRNTSLSRREALRIVGLAPLVAFAGCQGDSDANGGGSTAVGPVTSTPAGSPSPSPATAPAQTVTAAPAADAAPICGLQFPGDCNEENRRFRRTLPNDSIPDPYPLTVIFQAYPQDNGVHYQTFFFHGIEGDYSPNSDKFYGCAPYPLEQVEMRWEIAANSQDFTGDLMTYDRWFNCAFVAWADDDGKHHRFYYDLPDTSKVVEVDLPPDYFSSLTSTHSFTWGDAPWDHVTFYGGKKEQYKGILRRLKIFTTALSLEDATAEAQSDEVVSLAGAMSTWYLNANPRPDDLTDKSGNGNDFRWYEPENTASLWTSEPPSESANSKT